MFYLKVICYSYSPNNAATRRHLGIIQGLSELGAQLQVTFLLPDGKFSKYSGALSNVSFKYSWGWLPIKIKAFHMLFYKVYTKRFLGDLKKGDVVLLFGLSDILHKAVDLPGIKVYHERNEHPEAVLTGSKVAHVSLNDYLKSCKLVDGLFVISNSLKKYFIEQGMDAWKVHVVNMFVNTGQFDGLVADEKGEEQYVAYCGAGYNQKDGVDTMIKAFSVFHNKFPEVKLYIIGPKEESPDYNDNLMLCKKLGVDDYIVFTGVRPNSEIPRLLVNSKAVLLDRPSNQQTQSGFPNKLGEYLMSGVPAVVTKVGDIPLFLTDKKNAMVAEPDNYIDFAEKLIWLFEHPKEAKQIGENGRETALKHFNYLIESKKILNIINNNL